MKRIFVIMIFALMSVVSYGQVMYRPANGVVLEINDEDKDFYLNKLEYTHSILTEYEEYLKEKDERVKEIEDYISEPEINQIFIKMIKEVRVKCEVAEFVDFELYKYKNGHESIFKSDSDCKIWFEFRRVITENRLVEEGVYHIN